MPVHVAGRRRSAASLAAAFPGAESIDVTSRAGQPWVRLSPFHPHGGIPVPYSDGLTGQSVEGAGRFPCRQALARCGHWPTRPGCSALVNSTVPSCSRSRTVSSPEPPSMSTSPKNW